MGVPFPSPAIEADPPLRSVRRKPQRQRLAGLAAAIALEALLVLALLTLGSGRMADMAKDGEPLKTFDLAAPSPEPVVEVKTVEPQVVVKPPTPRKTSPAVPGVSPPQEARAEPPSPQPTPLVQLAPGELAAADLRSLPSGGESKGKAGPPAPSGGGDSQVVEGSGPNGERLYAAAWQREPSHDELRGYLSTAQPAWAMIACRTVADFRVDDCVAVAEYPRGSQLARAVLAAAWQFRVRPPRIGGQLQVGEWVRIRIDYGLRRRAEWEKARE